MRVKIYQILTNEVFIPLRGDVSTSRKSVVYRITNEMKLLNIRKIL